MRTSLLDKDLKRSLRRHHRERLKRSRAGYWNGHAATSGRATGLALSAPHPCSGPCCGNPRRHFGERTVQERRAGVGEAGAGDAG